MRGCAVDGGTLVDVDGGQGAGSPVLSQAPPPPIPSGQIKSLAQCLCVQQQSKMDSRRGGWAGSLGAGSNQDRAAPTPIRGEPPASEPATSPPTCAAPSTKVPN